jgi:murein DD-endopeptidase MepM/ murein hydrolase activator NlpD
MSDVKNNKWKIFTDQLKNKYRLVILNDDSFAEKFSLRLSPLGLIILLCSVTIIMTTLVISLVAFTSLREYIPGYGNIDDRKNLILLSNKADSLEKSLSAREWYINNVLNVLSGNVETKPEKPLKDSTGKYKNIDIKPSEQDAKLRTEIENNQLQSTSSGVSANKSNLPGHYFFFTPTKGVITSSYNYSEQHYGIDIATKENEPVKATLDGTVVFSDYTKENGYVVHIQHNNNIVSVYKHLSNTSKKTSEFVQAGEPIGTVGNTGENSKGTHLHFELWYNGFPINPQEYVVF